MGSVTFNWVSALSECSLTKVFEQLVLDIEEDVRTRNAALPAGTCYAFAVLRRNGLVSVFMDAKNCLIQPGPAAVKFSLAERAISVTDSANKEIVTATVTFNKDRQCRFKVGAEEWEPWRFRMVALQDLFFATRGPLS